MRPALLLVPLALTACLVPPSTEEVDAALAQLQDVSTSGEAPIESELLELPADAKHHVAVLHTGADALTARIHSIRAARESIDIQTFVWGPDDAGKFLFQELAGAAQRGVRVRLLVDHMGTGTADGLAGVTAFHENLQIRIYNPTANLNAATNRQTIFKAAHSFGLLNHRMHNKVHVVDGKIGIVGGRNVQERYFDLDPEFDYIDRDVLVVGPEVEKMQRSFDAYWEHELAAPAEYLYDVRHEIVDFVEENDPPEYEFREFPRLDWAVERADNAEAALVMPFSPLLEADELWFLADPPGKRAESGELVRQMGLEGQLGENLDEYMLVQSNYCVFSGAQFRRLKRLRERKPDVEIHFQTNSRAAAGCGACWAIYRKQRMAMMLRGLRLYELRPVPEDVRHFNARFEELVAEDLGLTDEQRDWEDRLVAVEQSGPQIAIHAKTIVVDGEITLIGSHNFDPRSEVYNTEAAVLIRDDDVAANVEAELRLAMSNANSWTVAPDPKVPVWRDFSNLVAHVSRSLPTLDVWPSYYATSYELREGAEPVPIDDARFYANYENVGSFPEVESGWKKFTTWLISAFGGFAAGLL